jgi:RNA polymerase sigma factor (sigma-70 family)
MATRPAALLPLLTKAQSADADCTTTTDRDLLRRFARDKDEAAFAMLVHRHGPMVLGACRRVLGNPADAEDACQATFVVLARKAAARWQPSVATWLYVTARRVALNARTARARRARHEGRARTKPPANPLGEITGEELLAILDEELGRLPQRYQAPVVLCCLEGQTRDEAARQLGVPAATLKGQLERGRRRLQGALARRGVSLGAGLLALMATSRVAASPSRFVEAIRAAVGGKVSPTIAALADRVTVNGLLKKSLAIVALVGVAALGLGLGAMSAEPPKPATEKPDQPAVKTDPKDANPKPERSERTITGKVLGADGKPIVAELFVNWVEGKSEPLGKSMADGSFQVTIPVKEWGGWLTARANGHGMDFAGVGLNKESPSEITLRLPKDQPVRGSIIDPQGKPASV